MRKMIKGIVYMGGSILDMMFFWLWIPLGCYFNMSIKESWNSYWGFVIKTFRESIS